MRLPPRESSEGAMDELASIVRHFKSATVVCIADVISDDGSQFTE